MRLRLNRTALTQIQDALDYIGARSSQGAESMRQRINAALDVLQAFPYAGSKTNRPGFRRLVLTPHPYVLVYRVTVDEIVVLRLRHTARRPI